MSTNSIPIVEETPLQSGKTRTSFDVEGCLASIPGLPGVVSDVLALLDDNELNSKALAKAIEADYPLSQRVIRVANSAYFSPLDRINSVSDAVRILGFESVRSLAIITTVVKGLWVADDLFDRCSFWLHGLRCGIIARRIAQFLKHPNPEMLFTVGVMHDIGRLALIQFDPKQFHESLELMNRQGLVLWKAEKQVMGLHHGEIGGLLAQKWQLPESMIASIRFHHESDAAHTFAQGTQIIGLADAMAHSVNPHSRAAYIAPPLLPVLWHPLGLSDPDVREIYSERETIERDARLLFESATSQ